MKNRSNPFLIVAISLATSFSLPAAVLFWDGSNSTANADGGAGTWDTATANWNDAATAGNSVTWPAISSLDDDASFGGTSGVVTIATGGVSVNGIAFETVGYVISGDALTLDGSLPTIATNGGATIESVISGSAGLSKTGTETLTLTGANVYTGPTLIGGGTLALTSGSNRLAVAGSVGFSAAGTLDLGGNGQTLANLSITTATASTKGTITNGSLTLDGANALTLSPSVTSGGRVAEMDATGLSSLTISKSGQNINVGGLGGGLAPGSSGIFKLSAVTNSITSSAINIGATGAANASSNLNSGRLELGAANTIYANTWKLGTTRDGGIVQFQAGLTNPSATLRGQNGTDPVTSILIGENAAGATGVGSSHMNLSGGSVDILATTLTLGRGASGSVTPAVNGSFSMGGGSLTVGQIWLSKNEGSGLNNNTSAFTQGGGTVKVTTLTLAQTTATGTTLPVFNSQYTLNGGTLNAGSISAGTGVFATTSTRRINFNGGTITHLDAATDLSINGVTGTGGSIGIALGTAGSPTIHAATDRTVTVGNFTSISGTGSLLKTGPGQLLLNNPTNTASGTFRPSEGSVIVGANNSLAGLQVILDPADSGTLSFTGTTAIALGGLDGSRNLSVLNNLAATQDLTLGNAVSGTYTGIISGAKSIRKVGTGTQIYDPGELHTASLAGLSTSGGRLELNSGTYTVTGTAGTAAPDSITGFLVSRGGTFRLNGANVTATSGTYLFTAGNTGGGNSNFILDSGTFNANGREVLNAYGAAGTTTINGGLFICNGFKVTQNTGILNLNGGTLRVNRLYGDGNTSTINFNGGTLQARQNNAGFIDGTITNALVKVGGAIIDSNEFNITIPEALLEDSGSTGGGLTKIGAGTLTLTAANTYTGDTSVEVGTLALVGGSQTSPITVESDAALGFTLGSPTTSTSTVTFTGATPKVTVTGTPVAATLMTASSFVGTPVLDPAIPGFALAVEDGGTTLKLVAASSNNYETWATTNGVTGQAANLDHDNDGVSNGVEYFIGGPSGNTTGFTALPSVTTVGSVRSITWTKATSYTGVYNTDFFVETSDTLGAGSWTTEPSPGTVSISGNDVTYTFPAGPVKKFARLKVTGP